MPLVTYPEMAFLKLIARRVVLYSKEAASRGESYTDLTPFSPLQCGARVRYRFDPVPGGYCPAVQLRAPTFHADEQDQIALEILEGPSKRSVLPSGDLEYVRLMDDGVPIPD